jgi:hypothetical protein
MKSLRACNALVVHGRAALLSINQVAAASRARGQYILKIIGVEIYKT